MPTDVAGKIQEGGTTAQRVLSVSYNGLKTARGNESTAANAYDPILNGTDNSCGKGVSGGRGGDNIHEFQKNPNGYGYIIRNYDQNRATTEGSPQGNMMHADCNNTPFVRYGPETAANADWVAEPASGTDCSGFVLRNTGCNRYVGVGDAWNSKSNRVTLVDAKANAQKFWFDKCKGTFQATDYKIAKRVQN